MALCDKIIQLIDRMQAKGATLEHNYVLWVPGGIDGLHAETDQFTMFLKKKVLCEDSNAVVQVEITSYLCDTFKPLINTVDFLRKIYAKGKCGGSYAVFTQFKYSYPDEATRERKGNRCYYVHRAFGFRVEGESDTHEYPFGDGRKLDFEEEYAKMLKVIDNEYYPKYCKNVRWENV